MRILGRRPVCDLRHVRRLRRHLQPRRRAARARQPDAPRRRRRNGLRKLVRAYAVVDAVGDFPAAPVSDDGGRKRERAPSAARGVALSGLPAVDQPVRAAHRPRRPALFRRQRRRPGHLRAHLAPGRPSRRAGAAGVRRRSVGRHGDGDRRVDRGVDHGLQRPRDAAVAAAQGLGAGSRDGPEPPSPADQAVVDCRYPAARLSLLPPCGRSLRACEYRPHQLRRGGAVRTRDARRHVLAGRLAQRCACRAGGGIRDLDLLPVAALVRQVGLARQRFPRVRAARHRAAAPRAVPRAGGARPDQPCAVLEPVLQHRLLPAVFVHLSARRT